MESKKAYFRANESTDKPSLIKFALRGLYFEIMKHTVQGKYIDQSGSMDSISPEWFVFWNEEINISRLKYALGCLIVCERIASKRSTLENLQDISIMKLPLKLTLTLVLV